MQLTLKKLGASRTQATAVFEVQQVEHAEEEAVKGLGANVRVPGFRPGKAPLSLLREHLSPERVREETVHQLLPAAMQEIRAKGLKPIVTPRVELTVLAPFTLLITLVEKPEAKVRVKDIEKAQGKEKKSVEESVLLDMVADATTVELAPELIDEEVRSLLTQHVRRLDQASLSFEDFLTQAKKKPEDFLKEMRPIAEKRLKTRLGISSLIEEWKIVVSDEEVTQAVTALLAPLPEKDREELKKLYVGGSHPYEQLRFQKTVEKVLRRLHFSR